MGNHPKKCERGYGLPVAIILRAALVRKTTSVGDTQAIRSVSLE
jgi:hypothetical protein